MPLVKLDRDMVVEDLYRLRSLIQPENDEARRAVMDLVDVVTKAALAEENTGSFPRLRSGPY
jgi:hypothetical protein